MMHHRSTDEVIVKVNATYHLTVEVGDTIRRGEVLSEAPEAQAVTAPVSGVVRRVRFDPQNHEFIVAIVPTEM